uniref:SFRICE_034228 n=1 Tax=Spodoptera frugiperda TaxID=7108 RepID=A0A2H1WYX0_SPOFR
MKLFASFVVLLAVLALLISVIEANPKVKAGSVAKNGLRAINAAGNVHDAYKAVKNRKNQG